MADDFGASNILNALFLAEQIKRRKQEMALEKRRVDAYQAAVAGTKNMNDAMAEKARFEVEEMKRRRANIDAADQAKIALDKALADYHSSLADLNKINIDFANEAKPERLRGLKLSNESAELVNKGTELANKNQELVTRQGQLSYDIAVKNVKRAEAVYEQKKIDAQMTKANMHSDAFLAVGQGLARPAVVAAWKGLESELARNELKLQERVRSSDKAVLQASIRGISVGGASWAGREFLQRFGNTSVKPEDAIAGLLIQSGFDGTGYPEGYLRATLGPDVGTAKQLFASMDEARLNPQNTRGNMRSLAPPNGANADVALLVRQSALALHDRAIVLGEKLDSGDPVKIKEATTEIDNIRRSFVGPSSNQVADQVEVVHPFAVPRGLGGYTGDEGQIRSAGTPTTSDERFKNFLSMSPRQFAASLEHQSKVLSEVQTQNPLYRNSYGESSDLSASLSRLRSMRDAAIKSGLSAATSALRSPGSEIAFYKTVNDYNEYVRRYGPNDPKVKTLTNNLSIAYGPNATKIASFVNENGTLDSKTLADLYRTSVATGPQTDVFKFGLEETPPKEGVRTVQTGAGPLDILPESATEIKGFEPAVTDPITESVKQILSIGGDDSARILGYMDETVKANREGVSQPETPGQATSKPSDKPFVNPYRIIDSSGNDPLMRLSVTRDMNQALESLGLATTQPQPVQTGLTPPPEEDPLKTGTIAMPDWKSSELLAPPAPPTPMAGENAPLMPEPLVPPTTASGPSDAAGGMP